MSRDELASSRCSPSRGLGVEPSLKHNNPSASQRTWGVPASEWLWCSATKAEEHGLHQDGLSRYKDHRSKPRYSSFEDGSGTLLTVASQPTLKQQSSRMSPVLSIPTAPRRPYRPLHRESVIGRMAPTASGTPGFVRRFLFATA